MQSEAVPATKQGMPLSHPTRTRGRGATSISTLPSLGLVHHYIAAAALAPDAEQDLFVLYVFGEFNRIIRTGNRLSVDFLDDISRTQAGLESSGVRGYIPYHRAFDCGRELKFVS